MFNSFWGSKKKGIEIRKVMVMMMVFCLHGKHNVPFTIFLGNWIAGFGGERWRKLTAICFSPVHVLKGFMATKQKIDVHPLRGDGRFKAPRHKPFSKRSLQVEPWKEPSIH